ncbi:MAG: YdjY domain-containing protein [Planctomycetota bacterium]|nr:YdjY domain-containing protein [Planctomycetota bacterium]
MLRLLPLLALAAYPLVTANPATPAAPAMSSAQDAATELFAADGIHLDRKAGFLAVETQVQVTNELLEYLLVGAAGAAHESLLLTESTPSLINAAILSLGLDQGQNARYEPIDPPPTEEQLRAGARSHDIVLPEGDGLLPYLAWREGPEVYLMRAEDAICDLAAGRSMRRHRWVYLGSRFAVLRGQEEEVYVADVEQNLINLAFFTEGNSLATAALPECQIQTIWRANPWLVPPPGAQILLVLSKDPLTELPPELVERLPEPSRERQADR